MRANDMRITKDNGLQSQNYLPTKSEEYMNPKMLAYFKDKLLSWKDKLVAQSQNIQRAIAEQTERTPDHVDEAITEENLLEELIFAERNDNLIEQINRALHRIETKEYGYCEKTGEKIGVGRLEAWPIANYTIGVQEAMEKRF
jgi:DnaK suppressor protein